LEDISFIKPFYQVAWFTTSEEEGDRQNEKTTFPVSYIVGFPVSVFGVYPVFISCDKNQHGIIEIDYQSSLPEIHPSP